MNPIGRSDYPLLSMTKAPPGFRDAIYPAEKKDKKSAPVKTKPENDTAVGLVQKALASVSLGNGK